MISLLLSYYPIKFILGLWLPKFRDSIFYASLLFPMCLFESKTTMLINTYLKALRKERWLCLANIITVGMSFILSVITVYILKNLLLTVLLIPVLFAFRCLILEYPLAKLLNISVMKEALTEIAVAALFIIFNYFLPAWLACVLYFCVVAIYIAVHKDSIIETLDLGR